MSDVVDPHERERVIDKGVNNSMTTTFIAKEIVDHYFPGVQRSDELENMPTLNFNFPPGKRFQVVFEEQKQFVYPLDAYGSAVEPDYVLIRGQELEIRRHLVTEVLTKNGKTLFSLRHTVKSVREEDEESEITIVSESDWDSDESRSSSVLLEENRNREARRREQEMEDEEMPGDDGFASDASPDPPAE